MKRKQRRAQLGKAPAGSAQTVDHMLALEAAVGLHQAGRFVEAEQSYHRILAADPHCADAWHLQGVAVFQLGRAEDALELIAKAIQTDAGQWHYFDNLAAILKAQGRIEEAAAAYQAVIERAPENLAARQNLGDALYQLGHWAEAASAFQALANLAPDDANAHIGLGGALFKLERLEDAATAFRTVIRLAPHHAAAHANLGSVLYHLRRLDKAVGSFDAALAIDPANALTHRYRGEAFHLLGRQPEAILSFEQAIACSPDDAVAHTSLAISRLLVGDWLAAWPEYEWRWGMEGVGAAPVFAQPQWRGEDLTGRTILLHAEQGLGDTIQFCSYAPMLAARGARVMLAAPRSLLRLLRGLEGVDQVVAMGDPLPAFDVHCPLLSLPGVFGTTVDTTPPVPHLHAEASLAEHWRERLGDHGFRIGIVWQGSRDSPADRGRSAPLIQFAGLAAIPGVRLISLQKGHGLEQLESLPEGMTVETLGPDFDSGPDAFVDTAAVMAGLDLVVTVDSAPGVLAGALGRPVWVALQAVPHWAWTQTGERSPWHPSARAFRQADRGDWNGPFSRMVEALHEILKPPAG